MSIGVRKGGSGGGGGGGGSVPFPDVTGDPLDNTALAPYLNSVTNLENNESKYLYWQSVSSNSGTVTIPTGATVLLGEIMGLNALVETIASGKPTGNSPKTTLGASVIVSSFDTSGNYVLSGTPSSFPVAIIFVFKIKAKDISNVDLNFVLADETVQTETTFGNFIQNLTVDSAPQDTDTTVISDPTDSNRAKKLSLLTLWLNYIKARADAIYLAVMTGATAALNGARGMVPTPLAGEQNHLFVGDGTWKEFKNVARRTVTNDNAASGFVGEIVTASGSGGVANGVPGNLGSISLPAGDWNVKVSFTVTATGGSNIGGIGVCSNITSGVFQTGFGSMRIWRSGGGFIANLDNLSTGFRRYSLSTTTTVFCVGYIQFSAGAPTISWAIEAEARR